MLLSSSKAELALIALLSVLSTVSTQPSSCQSFGIDFQHGGTYCVNSASADNFTFVTEFEGCATTGLNTYANTLLVLPDDLDDGAVLECSDLDDTQNDVNQQATCPIAKNELISGNYLIILAGNNGNETQYAYFRNFTLNVGPQQTVTYTPTVTYTVTTTPSTTITTTLYTTTTSTFDATTTYYTPAATAPCEVSVYPEPVSTTITETLTWHRNKYIASQIVSVATVTPSCIYPSPWADPAFTIWPEFNNPWLVWNRPPPNPWNPWGRRESPKPTQGSAYNELVQKARQQGRHSERDLQEFEERAPDACTVTLTASLPVNVTTMVAAPTWTETDSTTITATIYTTLPPSTVPSGTTTLTTTLPPATRTRLQLTYTTSTTLSTLTATYTQVWTMTPPGAKASCRAMGGYLANQGGW